MSNDCIICADKFNHSTRLPVKCQYCDFVSCRECCRKFLLNEYTPKCMNTQCDREWTREFLVKHFPLSFINNDYKKHKQDILYERELTLMPATQIFVENSIRKDEIKKEIAKIEQSIHELQMQTRTLLRESYNLFTTSEERRRLGVYNNSANDQKTAFVRKCPVNDCNGFLSTQWKCGICQNWTCPDCHIVKGLDRNVEHTCNEDDKNTALLLSQNTKQCPKCNMGIFKIEGCDQMWCTACNTAFSWRTGLIISNSSIHNPHYFEWQARQNRNALIDMNYNAGCRHIDHRFVSSLIDRFNSIHNYHTVGNCACGLPNCSEIKAWTRRHSGKGTSQTISNIARQVIHIREIVINGYDYDIIRNNEKLRIAFMKKEIDEDKFKSLLQIANKKHERQLEYTHIYNMVVEAVTDILYRFMNEILGDRTDPNQYKRWNGNLTTLGELQNIREYANECLANVSAIYKTCKYQLNDDFEIVSIKNAC